jgi:deazaflavin-dependent oxidoreductase (nitroreductase family)
MVNQIVTRNLLAAHGTRAARYAATPMVKRHSAAFYRLIGIIGTCMGRRTGKVREIPLFAFEDGDRLVVIGSNMSQDHEPAWVGNLRGHPEVRARVGRELRAVRAREAGGEERDRLWRLAAAGYPGYEHYARWTHRQIPVVVLEPRSLAEAAA